VVEADKNNADRVRQRIYFPSDEEKLPLLLRLLSRSEGARTMVFVNTKAYVERVARALEQAGYRVGVLSGDVPQKKRESLLRRFQAGQLEILVATDVAARGLHIDGVQYVYNFDLPFDPEDYVHRIGRTARLGAEGDAISFACERYAMSLPDIEAYIGQKIPVEPVTAELLTPLPRPPRQAPAGGEGEEAGESVGEIFREARAQRAAEEERRGGRRRRGRGERAGGERGGDGRPRRRPQEGAAQDAAGEEQAGAAAPAQPAQTPAAGSGEAPARLPRKRRRRRRGKPVDAAAQAAGNGNHNAQPGAPARERQAAPAPKPEQGRGDSFLTRLGRKLRALVTGG